MQPWIVFPASCTSSVSIHGACRCRDAGVWTSNIGRALKMAHELEAGTIWTNTYRVSSPLSPFGGYKRSGFGRESGLLAIREFVQEKSIWIETSGADTPNPFVIR